MAAAFRKERARGWQQNTHLHQLPPAFPIGAHAVDDLRQVDSPRQVVVRPEGADRHQGVIATGGIHLVSVHMRLFSGHKPKSTCFLIFTFSSRVGMTTSSSSLICMMG